MDTFAPEFAKYWRPETRTGGVDATGAARDDDTGAQAAALQELAERVSAARSVV